MAKQKMVLNLTADDFEFDAEGNLRIKNFEQVERLLKVMTQAKTARRTKASPGPKVKVEM